MKLLICSDSHGVISRLVDAVECEFPDIIIHLGDMVCDADALSDVFPHIPVERVAGNCDGWSPIPPERRLVIEGVTILMGHGHTWHVKRGSGGAIRAARDAGADLLLYGHTHIACCFQDNGLWVFNPGSARDEGENASSYGIVTIRDGQLKCSLHT